ncbi:MAG TPA: radical SAM protein [Vicinamibacterales bacterium]|nr:radical SAM protein [Vicinamibacterales bacterium]
MPVVYEIYASLQGESTYTGVPCAFVRLAACDLRCEWCDTPYAFTGGRKMSIDEIVAAVRDLGVPLVELTGGEPLLQKETPALMQALIDAGHKVLLETGGHRPIDDVPDDVVTILDVKCPGSGEAGRMHWPNLDQLSRTDEVKFVIRDRADFDYAVDVVRRHDLTARVGAVLFSPVHGVLEPAALAAWILESRLPIRLQLQAHKYIWGVEARGV